MSVFRDTCTCISKFHYISLNTQSKNDSKILELNTENYKEEILFIIEPNFYNDIVGTHHYSFDKPHQLL